MHKIICINRQFGSGGHEIAVKAASRLGIKVYEKELLRLACHFGEVAEKTLCQSDEKTTNPYLFQGVYEGNHHVTRGLPTSEVLFSLQSHEILRIAQRENCIFVGRCANWVLREQPDIDLLSVFVSADLDDRVARKMELEHLSSQNALKLVKKMDAQRRKYHETYTGQCWDAPERYDLMINTSETGIDQAVERIVEEYTALQA